MSPDLSFVRGGRRKLTEVQNPNDPASPTEIWASEEGELFTRCGGDIVAGPIAPAKIVQAAEAVTAGGSPPYYVSQMLAMLILALAHRGDRS